MVTEDYGKLAYVKLNSLEKRIEKLENFAMESVYSEIFYNLGSSEMSDAFTKKFKVNALKDGVYSITSNLETDLVTLLSVKIEVYVNNVLAYSVKNLFSAKHSFTFDSALNKGENEITAKVSSSNIFTLVTLNFKICGNVSYVKSINDLSHISINNIDYISHFKDGECIIYRYSEGILQKFGSFIGLKECSIISVDTSFLYIIAIDLQNNLILLTFDVLIKSFKEYDLMVSGVDSACGYYENGKFIIYFTRLSDVFKGIYLLNSTFSYTSTGKKGVKLYSDPKSNGNMVVVDKYLNAKLFTD